MSYQCSLTLTIVIHNLIIKEIQMGRENRMIYYRIIMIIISITAAEVIIIKGIFTKRRIIIFWYTFIRKGHCGRIIFMMRASFLEEN